MNNILCSYDVAFLFSSLCGASGNIFRYLIKFQEKIPYIPLYDESISLEF